MGYGFVIAVVVVALLLLWNGVKIVRDYQRLVVFRLGRSFGPRGPGLVYLIPIVDKAVWVDLREAFLEIPAQTCITKDNAPISIDFLIYWKVFDPQLSVIQVGNFAGAAQGIATTGLRAVIGDLSLDEALTKRDQINQVMRAKL
ncbi:MAG TPA: paraslipin, partial [bacterium]|nr:paraslipin [bacterium]